MKTVIMFGMLLVSGIANAAPGPATILYSGLTCKYNAYKTDIVKEIAKEKRYSKQVGVVDLEHLQELKTELRRVNDELAKIHHWLPRPLACSGEVKTVSELDCISSYAIDNVWDNSTCYEDNKYLKLFVADHDASQAE